jgi:serine/threonine protein kinase
MAVQGDRAVMKQKIEPIHWIGQTLDDDFLIEDKIGQGGFAIVFRARQLSLNRHVVVKILRQELCHEELLVARFKRESHVAARLTHPNIASIFHTGNTPQGPPFFVMELIPGLPLSKVLKQGPLAPKRAAKILRQVAEALDVAHQQGITHRDLKPDNMMVTQRPNGEHIKLLDFGIAREEGGKNLTRTGELIGTPEYMSPEQSEGHRITKASDIYSLGVMAFEMLARRTPFHGPPVKVLFQHVGTPAPTLAEVVKKPFPKPIEDCIAKALAKHPAHRHKTASEFAIQLMNAIEVAGEAAIPVPSHQTNPDPEANTLATPQSPEMPPTLQMTDVAPTGATLQLTDESHGQTIREVRENPAEIATLRQPTPTNIQPEKITPPQEKPTRAVSRPKPQEEPDEGAIVRYVGIFVFVLAFVVLLVLLWSN